MMCYNPGTWHNSSQVKLTSEESCQRTKYKKKKKKTMAPFYGGGSTGSRLEPLRGGSLLFTTTFPEIPATHVIDHGRMSQFWSQPVVLNTGPLDGESSALTNRPLLKIQLGTIVPISLGNNCAMCQGCST